MFTKLNRAFAALLAGNILFLSGLVADDEAVASAGPETAELESVTDQVASDGRMSTDKAIAIFEKRIRENQKDVMSPGHNT